MKALQVLIKTIYTPSESEETQVEIQGLAKDACEECITILREPEKSQARPATRILCSFMATTGVCSLSIPTTSSLRYTKLPYRSTPFHRLFLT